MGFCTGLGIHYYRYYGYQYSSPATSAPYTTLVSTTIDTTTSDAVTLTSDDTTEEEEDISEDLTIGKQRLLVLMKVDHDEDEENIKEIHNSTLSDFVTTIAYIKDSSRKHTLYDLLHQVPEDVLFDHDLVYLAHTHLVIIGINLAQLGSYVPGSGEVMLGKRKKNHQLCDPSAGVLINLETAEDMVRTFQGCVAADKDILMEDCLEDKEEFECNEKFLEHSYEAVKYDDDDLNIKDVIAIYNVPTVHLWLTLMREVMINYQNLYKKKVEKIESQVKKLIKYSDYNLKRNIPLCSSPKYKSTSRYDRDIFTSFNLTCQLNRDDYDPYTELTKHERQETAEVLNVCKIPEEEFVTGWARYDATRGVDYIMGRRNTGAQCSAVRELSLPAILPMPGTVPGTGIVLVIPVSRDNIQHCLTLIRSFVRRCLEKQCGVSLVLILLYTPPQWGLYRAGEEDTFKMIKSRVGQIVRKYRRKQLLSHQSFSSTIINNHIIDKTISKLDSRAIILMGSPRMEIIGDYFLRVRQNTVLHRQVFCPIPFTEFHPKIIYERGGAASLKFHPNNGYFDSLNQEHISFYKADWDRARSVSGLAGSLQELFSKGSYHRLVVVEPGLHLRYEDVLCDQQVRQEERRRCVLRRRRSLGRRSQLGALILEKGL